MEPMFCQQVTYSCFNLMLVALGLSILSPFMLMMKIFGSFARNVKGIRKETSWSEKDISLRAPVYTSQSVVLVSWLLERS